jgi:hypothetical protein
MNNGGATSKYLVDFILMDVICNRKITPAATAARLLVTSSASGVSTTIALDEVEHDAVVMAPAV